MMLIEYLSVHSHWAHRKYTGMVEIGTKNPAKSICGTKIIGVVSNAAFTFEVAHPRSIATELETIPSRNKPIQRRKKFPFSSIKKYPSISPTSVWDMARGISIIAFERKYGATL
mmetsp:Transcript_4864/g.8799  ORF Transcript_4864/g.8799 Transcript_4864/m.8799 type:complete len:114 (-) Transcript_4864:1389-1730(-)